MSDNPLARAWVQQVERHADDEELPDHVVDGIVSVGAPAGALLDELLVAPSTWDTFLAEHCIYLLGELRYEPAAQHLSDMLFFEPAWEPDAREALVMIGEAAVPFLLTHARLQRWAVLPTLVELTAGQGREDVREVAALALEDDPEEMAFLLTQLDDRELLPAMMATLERLDEQDPENRDTLVELVDAIEAFGGDPGEEGYLKVHAVRTARAMWLAQQAAKTKRPKRGRGKTRRR